MQEELIPTLFLVWVLFMSSLILLDIFLIIRNIHQIRDQRYWEKFEDQKQDEKELNKWPD